MNNVWWDALKASSAVWEYSGDPRAPHVVLRSGKHSDGFIDTLQFLSKVEHLVTASRALAEKLNRVIGHSRVDWVFGSPMAGIPIATATAPRLAATRIGFTEKKGGDKELLCRYEVAAGENVLLVEEMTTSGGTPQRGIEAILAKNPDARILPFVGAFLIRCDTRPPELRGAELITVVNLPQLGISFNEWEASECPLCKAGSKAISNCKQVWTNLLRTMSDPTHPIK